MKGARVAQEATGKILAVFGGQDLAWDKVSGNHHITNVPTQF